MRKAGIAFVAGVASFFPWMFIGESLGMLPAFVFVAAYYFVCELFLARGRARAYATEWATMLALDASTFLVAIITVAVENRGVLVSQTLPLVLCTVGGTYAGAVLASLAARGRWPVLGGSGALPDSLVVGAGALAFGLAGYALGAILGNAVGRAYPAVGWLASAGGFGGLALGIALGAHMVDRRRGRLALVSAGSLAIGGIAWATAMIGRAHDPSGRIHLVALFVGMVLELIAAVYLERRTAGVGRAVRPTAA